MMTGYLSNGEGGGVVDSEQKKGRKCEDPRCRLHAAIQNPNLTKIILGRQPQICSTKFADIDPLTLNEKKQSPHIPLPSPLWVKTRVRNPVTQPPDPGKILRPRQANPTIVPP